MGWVHASSVERAGEYLLRILVEERSVKYSRFYDGTDETGEKLRIALECDEMDCPELLMDLAAAELGEAGWVTTRELEDKLADEEPNYEITITDIGMEGAKAGRNIRYRDLDL